MVFTRWGFYEVRKMRALGATLRERGKMIDPLPWRAWVTLYRRRLVTSESTVSAGYRETLTRYEVERTSIHRT